MSILNSSDSTLFKLKHGFYKKDDHWEILNPQESEHYSSSLDLDCNLCVVGFALGFAIDFNKEFNEFCNKPIKNDVIAGESSNRICLECYSSDIQVWVEMQETVLILQFINADYMRLDTIGKPAAIGKKYFNNLLEDVMKVVKNNAHGFTLLEEKDGIYSVSELAKENHEFNKEGRSWQVGPTDWDHLDMSQCHMCALGFALCVASENTQDFLYFKEDKKCNYICFKRYGDWEISCTKKGNTFIVQHSLNDWYGQKGQPIVIYQEAFMKLLQNFKEVIENSPQGIKLEKEHDGSYSISKFLDDSKN